MDQSFDFVIVGGGSAGCALARRLSDRSAHRVLLLEAGPGDDNALIRMPKGFGRLLADPRYCYYHATNHLSAGGQRPDVWVRGKVLGGSSAVNGMVWHHGHSQDYDELGTAGLKGWSWAQIAHCFKQIEDHTLPPTKWRGSGGPIPVRVHPYGSALSEAMLQAGEAMGLKRKEDPNLPEQEGVSYVASNIDRRGRRVSAAAGFLTPEVRRRPNLTILTETQVTRVLFDGKRAVGVSCVSHGKRLECRAEREVILSAGTISSPHLLMLSGVGPAEHLQALQVPVVHDSPGVGSNLREHWLAFTQFRLRHQKDSQNSRYSGAPLLGEVLKYYLGLRSVMALGSYDVVAFVRTQPQLNRPDAQLMFAPYSLNLDVKDGAAAAMEQMPGMQFFGYPMRGTSEGRIRLKSADAFDAPLIEPNYLQSDYDRQTTVSMMRYLRRFMSQGSLKPFVIGELSPTAEAQTDGEIVDMVRRYGTAGLHACGTCKMGTDTMAVVDERLRVRGVGNLRVIDCSIFPEQLSGNTNAPVMAAAWRGADLVLEDHA